ncbi:MAG: methyl-accepting chemotaxis protein, partial [Nitrospirales bacterium]|nr:methyl-accepting chemotaxis protein [Nitrospirales bacterium]
MVKLGFQEWFQDLRTQSKLMVGFGVVSVIILTMTVIGIVTLRQLSAQSQTVYVDYTIPLSDFSSMGTGLTQHHELLLDIAKTNRKDDFQKEVARLVPLKQAILKNVTDYESTALRVSRSGRDEAKDLAQLKPALDTYFREAEAALSAFIDSFDSTQMTAEQGKEMRGLGVLALTTNLTPTFEKVIGRHGEQVMTMREVAKDLNDDSQGLARNGTLLLLLGGAVAVAMGLGIGFIMARYFSRGVIHIADVATQAASGHLQARAKLSTHDELGQMATAFNSMLDRITSLVQTEGERDQMQRQLMQFLALVSDVGKGDLTKRGTVTEDMFGNLADAFNLMLDRFGKLLRQVKEAAERVNSSAGNLRDTSGQMAGTAKHQAEESVRALSSVENLAMSMRQVAQTAGASSESAKQ